VNPTPANFSAFIRALEAELQRPGVAFGLRDLLAFAEAAWPLIRDDPDPGRWARAFLEARAPAAC
jgi:hypothetical protein